MEPDAEPGTMDDPLILDDLDEAATLNEPPPPSSPARGPEANAEDYMRWLVWKGAQGVGTMLLRMGAGDSMRRG